MHSTSQLLILTWVAGFSSEKSNYEPSISRLHLNQVLGARSKFFPLRSLTHLRGGQSMCDTEDIPLNETDRDVHQFSSAIAALLSGTVNLPDEQDAPQYTAACRVMNASGSLQSLPGDGLLTIAGKYRACHRRRLQYSQATYQINPSGDKNSIRSYAACRQIDLGAGRLCRRRPGAPCMDAVLRARQQQRRCHRAGRVARSGIPAMRPLAAGSLKPNQHPSSARTCARPCPASLPIPVGKGAV
jgi:hypothetical protein